MLRRERGQVTAEYVGVLLLVAVIVSALVLTGPARRITDEAARAVCQIAGQCSPGSGVPSVDPEAVQRAARDLQGVVAGDPDPAAVAAFFKGLDPDVADALAHERPDLVGNLDGAPIPLRYAANAEAVDREIVRGAPTASRTTTRACASCASSTIRTATSCSSTPRATAAPPRCSATSPPRATSRSSCPG
jgi:hypothetical protein